MNRVNCLYLVTRVVPSMQIPPPSVVIYLKSPMTVFLSFHNDILSKRTSLIGTNPQIISLPKNKEMGVYLKNNPSARSPLVVNDQTVQRV